MGSNMVRQVTQTLKKYLQPVGYVRWSRMSVAIVFVLSLFVPTFIQISEIRAYSLTPEVKKVLGSANKNLSAKFSFDKEGSRWQFNKNGVAALANNIAQKEGKQDAEKVADGLSQLAAQQAGGSGKNDTSLYSVDLPVKAKDGITYYDNVTRLSFKMVPTFNARDAKLVDDRIVYPFGGGGKVVYTAKNNGLKEDIILSDYIGDTLRYGYTLELPETLEARVLDDGSIGIYSANPALFGNISFNTDEDRARVMEGRKNGHKEHLVFGIPAPFIKDQNGKAGSTRYELDGKKLTVVASGLKGLSYPLTVDPSVTVTSSSDFEYGNIEDSININSSGQIDRAQLTGATIGAFTPAPNMNSTRALMDSVVYNGYLYAVFDWTGQVTTIEYAKIQSNGSLGSWTQQATGLSNRYGVGTAAYNGYLYITGGMASNPLNTTNYAKINSDGSIGTIMTASTNFSTPRYFHKTKIYNGYIYVVGGRGEEVSFDIPVYASVQFAKLKADGNIDTWSAATLLPTGRQHFGLAIYNDRMYVTGGTDYDNSPPLSNTKQFFTDIISTPINADGTLGSWTTNVATIPAAEFARTEFYAGNMYVIRTASISYAPVSLNGQIGTFRTTTAPPDIGVSAGLVIYNGYLYKYGGGSSSSDVNTAYYAKLNPAGSLDSNISTTSFDTAANGRSLPAVVATNGYLYVLGGNHEVSGIVNTGKFAAISSDGTVGSWSATNAFSERRSGATAIVHGSYLYLVGGFNNSNTANCADTGVGGDYCTNIEWATVNSSTGALTWQGSTYTFSTTGRSVPGVAVVNGYIYVTGGTYNNNSTDSTEANYAQVNTDGTLGAFATTTAAITSPKGFHTGGAFAWSGRLYTVGNRNTSLIHYATPTASGDITSWTQTGSDHFSAGQLQYYSVSMAKGVFYLSGGARLTTALTEMVEARIQPDGSVSNWSVLPQTLPVGTYQHTTITNKDNLYVVGGVINPVTPNEQETVYFYPINNGNNGDIQTWDATSTSFPTVRGAFGSFAYNGFLYVLGGSTTGGLVSGVNTQVYAPISRSGVVGAWTTIPNPPTMYGSEAWSFHNGYIYKLGGRQSVASSYANTWYAAVCTGANTTTVFSTNCTTGSAPGTLSSWNAGASMNTGRDDFGAVAHNGYLYVFGGCTGSGARIDWICTTESNTVEVSQINSTTGAPGTWTALSSGNDFTTPRFRHQTVAYNGYVYLIGGCANIPNLTSICDTDLSDVQVAKLNGAGLAADAGCGTVWCKQDVVVDARMEFGAAAYNGYLYITGGAEGPFNDVRFAPIHNGGSLGRWAKAHTNFNTARRGHNTVAYGGNLYVLGGTNTAGTTYYADVQFAGLKTIPRISKYSKLITLDPTTEVAGVYYNGLLNGDSSVTYRVAPNTGIFGSSTPATSGNGSEPTPLCGLGSIYYVEFTVTLKDTTTATFPESGVGNVTDVTTYYRLSATPPPNLRLNGGKWFYDEQPRPLDTCKI